MPDLPAHLSRYLTAVAVAQDVQEGMPEVHKLHRILEAALEVVEVYSQPFGGLVLTPELCAALDKLKEAQQPCQQPCQRCGGGGVWYRDEVDLESWAVVERSDFCPDCQGGAS